MRFRTLVVLFSIGVAACSQNPTELMLSTQTSRAAQSESDRPRDQDEERVSRVSERLALALASDCTGAMEFRQNSVERANPLAPAHDHAALNGAPEVSTALEVAGSLPAGPCQRFPIVVASASSLFASTNGARVRVSRGLVEFAQSDSELAFVLAHEMAHNLRGHSALVSAEKRFAEELEADRVGFGIISRAGYDRGAAIAILNRLGHAPGFATLDPRYPSFAARAAALSQDIETARTAEIKTEQSKLSP